MKFYTISGLGADERVFDYLKVNHTLVHLPWIDPLKNETLESYANRLSKSIDTTESFGLIGVSFGGMIATEITKILTPKITFLISSVSISNNLPYIYRLIGKSKTLKIIPPFCFNMPKFIANYFFGTNEKDLLASILNDTDTQFIKWCVQALTTWGNKTAPQNIIYIHGSKDKIIPLNNKENVFIIDNGGHLMIVDQAKEVSNIINSISL